VELSVRIFWALMVILMTASGYFGVNAEGRRRVSQGEDIVLEDGASVRLVRVIDGDTLLMETAQAPSIDGTSEALSRFSLRLLGVKAFSPDNDKDAATRFAHGAKDALERALRDRVAVARVHPTAQDPHGRTLASVWVADKDVGLALVRQGLVLVYVQYPFERLDEYLTEMEAARSERHGLWADAAVAERADMLLRGWRELGRGNR
jgi:endonuclease YncB( thermonuclease family)